MLDSVECPVIPQKSNNLNLGLQSLCTVCFYKSVTQSRRYFRFVQVVEKGDLLPCSFIPAAP
jgi:hypothetical protein